jgi:hypothetical protein
MKASKEENTNASQMERYIIAREEAYDQMRKELESQMEICKGKEIELQAENYLVKADLETMTHRAGKNSQQNDNSSSNGNGKRKRMSPGLQKQKELKRKTMAQVLKAFNWKKVHLLRQCWHTFSHVLQRVVVVDLVHY